MHNAQLVREKKKTSETRTAVKLELINACTPHPGATSLGSMEGRAHSPPNPCLVPLSFPSPSSSQSPEGHARSGMAQGGPGRAQIPSPPSQIAAPHRRRVVTLGLAVGVRGSPFS